MLRILSARKGEPDWVHILAAYNAEVARGIVHTAKWDEGMALLQKDWEAMQTAQLTSAKAKK